MTNIHMCIQLMILIDGESYTFNNNHYDEDSISLDSSSSELSFTK
jgi:hypothetical protein